MMIIFQLTDSLWLAVHRSWHVLAYGSWLVAYEHDLAIAWPGNGLAMPSGAGSWGRRVPGPTGHGVPRLPGSGAICRESVNVYFIY